MDIASVRGLFPGLENKVFLDAACVSLMPTPAAQALQRLTLEMLECPARDASAHHIALDKSADQPRREIAQLINASPEDIALVESTTQGLTAVAAAVPLRRGDKILVGDTEFLGLAVPWIPRQPAEGFTIEVIQNRAGRLLVEDFAHAVDSHTRMILLSSVQWSNGFRADIEGFSELARRHNLILVVDAIQQLGTFDIDVTRTPVDFLVCGGHKWLNAPVGRGFLYAHPRQQERAPVSAWGYLNITEPPQGWAEYFATPTIPAVRDYKFVDGARRFEVGGTANYPGNVALGEAVALINALGTKAIEAHITNLTTLLIEELQKTGATVVSPLEDGARSAIVAFTLGDGAERDRTLLQRLLDRKILISQRYTAGVGGLRVSVHFFNNSEDIHRLVEAVVECRE